jgi:hypothetical protein
VCEKNNCADVSGDAFQPNPHLISSYSEEAVEIGTDTSTQPVKTAKNLVRVFRNSRNPVLENVKQNLFLAVYIPDANPHCSVPD